MNGFRLELTNAMTELVRLREQLDTFSQSLGLPDPLINSLHLVTEEVVGNVIRYAFPKGSVQTFVVECGADESDLWLTIEDDGIPFNPLGRSSPDLDTPIDDWPIGGLGIFLVRSLMDHVEYDHSTGRNRLHLRKRLPTPESSS